MIAFIAGLVLGTWLGVLLMSILTLSKQADERIEKMMENEHVG
jgi:hypothetical protein